MPDSNAIAKVLASGYIFDAKAFDMINSLPAELDMDSFADRLLELKAAAPSETKMVTEDDVAKALPPGLAMGGREEVVPVEEEVELEVVSDPTPAISPVEANKGFNRLFRDRYDRLLEVVKRRPDARGISQVSETKGLGQGGKAKVAGLLASRTNRRSNVEISLDDPSGTARIVCQDEAVAKSAMEVPLDSMVVAEVSKGRTGQLYANTLLLPDVPGKRPAVSSHRVYAVLLSDLHVGSRMFLLEDFNRFVQWINGGLGDADVVSRIRYLIVAGDLVDGVGVYPGQEFQLAEKNPTRQYEMAAELLKQIPSKIQMVISPGNHDAVRQALPQPAVGADVAESLYAMDNVRWVGDPCYVKLHGVTFLIYHGKSLDDVIATTPDLTYDNPTNAMKLLLRSRHLAPTYGKRTALSPELRDFMVVDPVPDVMHSGHVHTFGELTYRGTLLVNSGTFQGQTNFQLNMGLDPTPSIVPVIDLSTLRVLRRNFGAAGFAGA
ncbi:MAG TPA: DNA-directed DNA polymerase II small subunit [Nitrososphaerales archaeon]|nr:DNA-directed DNA polymerase II small subunit [Nitrososphaerales archaeon]